MPLNWDAPPTLTPSAPPASMPSVLMPTSDGGPSDVRRVAVAAELQKAQYEQEMANAARAQRQMRQIRNVALGAVGLGLLYLAYRRWVA